MNYMTHPDKKIAKVLFMTWPAQCLSRKRIDDRSVKAGEDFTARNLFEPFAQLSKALGDQGKFLNLVVHSFGHQLLNGMVNPDSQFGTNIPKGIFENIFLMAPDITHLSVKKGGEKLTNYYKDKDGLDFQYQFSELKKLGKKVHVFHDKYDYLLYTSTVKFVGDHVQDKEVTKKYRNLGNYGQAGIDLINQEPDFNFIDVHKNFAREQNDDLINFPFRKIRKGPGEAVDKVWNDLSYKGINAFKIIFNAKRFPDHHRYLFTCKPVVDEVIRILG
jgi:hypothetical protein